MYTPRFVQFCSNQCPWKFPCSPLSLQWNRTPFVSIVDSVKFTVNRVNPKPWHCFVKKYFWLLNPTSYVIQQWYNKQPVSCLKTERVLQAKKNTNTGLRVEVLTATLTAFNTLTAAAFFQYFSSRWIPRTRRTSWPRWCVVTTRLVIASLWPTASSSSTRRRSRRAAWFAGSGACSSWTTFGGPRAGGRSWARSWPTGSCTNGANFGFVFVVNNWPTDQKHSMLVPRWKTAEPVIERVAEARQGFKCIQMYVSDPQS